MKPPKLRGISTEFVLSQPFLHGLLTITKIIKLSGGEVGDAGLCDVDRGWKIRHQFSLNKLSHSFVTKLNVSGRFFIDHKASTIFNDFNRRKHLVAIQVWHIVIGRVGLGPVFSIVKSIIFLPSFIFIFFWHNLIVQAHFIRIVLTGPVLPINLIFMFYWH